jgi:hypothetical protein
MDRPILHYVHTTTWAAADMEVVAIVPAEGGLRDIGMDIYAVIQTGVDDGVPIVFMTFNDSVKHFRKLVGTTVPIEMTGWLRKKGRFEPDSLRLHRVRALRKAWYTPRARET